MGLHGETLGCNGIEQIYSFTHLGVNKHIKSVMKHIYSVIKHIYSLI